MVNIHTDVRVLRVKTFSSFKVNPTQRFVHLSVFFPLLFFGKSLFYCREGGGGKEGAGGAVERILGGSRGFQAKLGQTVDNRLPMMGGGGKGRNHSNTTEP